MKIKPLHCPNCEEDMTLRKEDIKITYDGEIYDKWLCADCTHIIVLDWRDE